MSKSLLMYLPSRWENGSMNPLKLYRESLERELNEEEIQSLHKLIQQFPWFALPRMVLSKVNKTEDNISNASVYAVNRSYLQAYLDGKVYLKPRKQSPNHHPMEEPATPMPALPTYSLKHQLFSSVLFSSRMSAFSLDELPFSAVPPKKTEVFEPFLDAGTHLMVLKYLRLVKKIRQQIKQANPAARQQVTTIISEFLDKNPRIQRMELRSNSPLETPSSVQLSIEEDEDMVTETLAKLHLKQNNKSEAIRIYKKLGLLFPEKSAYFDAQIEKIKEP